MKNITLILLSGFPELQGSSLTFFLFLMMNYLITICGNLLVITLVSYSEKLHCPMYFFLTQLTTLDIVVTSDIVPNMLPMVLYNGSSMSIPQCITQFFVFSSSETSECLLLTVMSYDRYLAICHPLHYASMMNTKLCLILIIISWLSGFIVTSILTISMSQLQFCRSGIIDHFFCDFDPILSLSCSNIWKTKFLSTIICSLVILCPCTIVLISYGYIVHTILKIPTISHRQKAFSTCGSHLTVVSIFFGALLSVYLSGDRGTSVDLHKILSIIYCVLTPLLNPIIYCLRNKDIKEALKKIC